MTTALLLMDFEANTLGPLGGDESPALERAVAAVGAARDKGVGVIFIRVAFRSGYPEVNPGNRGFAPLKDYGDVFDEDNPGTQVHASLGRLAAEPVVLKRRMSAFASDLGELLRGRGFDHLVLTGVTTGGVVVSTLRYAADQDYRLTVLSDACADPDTELHDALVNRLFPQQAEVVTVDDWVKSL
jgi:nicotinamidase-related amidase